MCRCTSSHKRMKIKSCNITALLVYAMSSDFGSLANILSSQFEVITRPLLLLLGSKPLHLFIPLEGRHFVPCGNHFKYADTLSGLVESNFSFAVWEKGILMILFLFLRDSREQCKVVICPPWLITFSFEPFLQNRNTNSLKSYFIIVGDL